MPLTIFKLVNTWSLIKANYPYLPKGMTSEGLPKPDFEVN